MEIGEFLRRIRTHRFWAALVVLLAIVAAVLAAYRPMRHPLRLTSRTVSTGEATGQILVDAPVSTLANLKQDTLPLATRAGVFAQYMASSTIRDAVARALSLPPAAITSEGPYSGPGTNYNTVTPATAREAQLLDESKRYRLQFIAQQDLPLVTVYAHGPDPAAAARLADAVFVAVKDDLATYALGLSASDRDRRVIVRSLGPAQSAAVASGGGKALMVFAFGVVLVLGLAAIIVVGGPASGRGPERGQQHPWPDALMVHDDAEDRSPGRRPFTAVRAEGTSEDGAPPADPAPERVSGRVWPGAG